MVDDNNGVSFQGDNQFSLSCYERCAEHSFYSFEVKIKGLLSLVDVGGWISVSVSAVLDCDAARGRRAGLPAPSSALVV